MSRSGKNTTFGMFLILLIVSTIIAGIGQAILSGIIILILGVTGLDGLIVSVIVGIIIFILVWSFVYTFFFKGRTFR